MFTKKDKKIANQKAMIENRDRLIDDLKERKDYYKQISEAQREDLLEQEEALKAILNLATSNTYGNKDAILDKIKELAQTAIEN